MGVGAVAGQTDAMGRVVAGVWAGAPGNVRTGEMESEGARRRSQFDIQTFSLLQWGRPNTKVKAGMEEGEGDGAEITS